MSLAKGSLWLFFFADMWLSTGKQVKRWWHRHGILTPSTKQNSFHTLAVCHNARLFKIFYFSYHTGENKGACQICRNKTEKNGTLLSAWDGTPCWNAQSIILFKYLTYQRFHEMSTFTNYSARMLFCLFSWTFKNLRLCRFYYQNWFFLSKTIF